MNHLFEDLAKLGRALGGTLSGFTVRGRLLRAIRVSRPNWPEGFCAKAADALSRNKVKGAHQFTSKVDYLSYLDIQLTRYVANNPLVEVFPVADELGLKRWEQRWEASRKPVETELPTRPTVSAHNHEAA